MAHVGVGAGAKARGKGLSRGIRERLPLDFYAEQKMKG